ncbi:uncharacterized protein LOC144104072 isoform X5 [Amblyomma americanum]
MASCSPTCELEEGEISEDAEEMGDYDARIALVPRPPAKPFGIAESSSRSSSSQHQQQKSRPRVRSSASAPSSRYYKKPLCASNPPNGSHYDRNAPSHSSRAPGLERSVVRSTVQCRIRGCVSRPLPPLTSRDACRTSSVDGRGGVRRSHLDHYSWFRRSSSSAASSSRGDTENTSSSKGRFPPAPSSQRSRSDRSPSPPSSHSQGARKNQSQPKFLQNSVKDEPSYEELLAQYRSIQHQLEDLNKHSIEEQQPSSTGSREKSSKPTERRKKTHKPRCRKARKSLSEVKPKEVLSEEIKEQVPPSAIPVICDGNIETRSMPSAVVQVQRPPSPPPRTSPRSDNDEEDADLIELRRKALESIKSAKSPQLEEKPPDDIENASVLPLEVLPSDLLEADRPIQEVQEKQQLKRGQRHPWHDRELTQQMRRKDRAYHKWKRHPCYDNWEAFKALKREYMRMLKRKRAAYAQANASQDLANGAATGTTATEAPPGNVAAVAVGDGVASTMLPLDSIPLPNGHQQLLPQLSGDNYEPVEMEVDSDDGAQTPALEVAGGSDDEDEEVLRAQLLQAVLQRRHKPKTPEAQQQLHQHPLQHQLPQQLQQQQQTPLLQQRANHRTPLSPLNSATPLAVQPLVEVKEASRTASPKDGQTPKSAQPAILVTPRMRHMPKAAEVPFLDTKKTEPVVINLCEDDTTSEEEGEDESEAEEEPVPAVESFFSLGLDRLLKEARQKSQVPPPAQIPAAVPATSTPTSVMKLSQAQQLEYRRLKAEIARRELRSAVPTADATDSAQQQQQLNRARRLKQQASAKRSLEILENTLHAEWKALRLEGKRMDTLRTEVLTKKSAVRGTQVRIQRLRDQLATLERLVAGHAMGIRKANIQLQTLQMAVDKRKGHIDKLENQCKLHGKVLYGDKYQLPATPEGAVGSTPVPKRKISISSLQQMPKRARISGPDTSNRTSASAHMKRTDAAFLAEKIRLQKLEAEMRQRLQELKQNSLAMSSSNAPAVTASTAVTASSEASSKAPGPAAPLSRVASPVPPALKVASRKVVVTTAAGKDTSVASGKATSKIPSNSAEPSAPSVKVTITVGSSDEVAEKTAPGIHHRAAMEALFLDHCAKQLQSFQPRVGLSSSEFSVPHKDALKKLELCLLRQQRDAVSMTAGASARHHHVDISVPYVSPLLAFRGYRLNPNFLKQPGQSLTSTAYAHKMNPRIPLCRYELDGACYDEQCSGQHERDYKCTPDEIMMDLALYSPPLLKITPSDSPEQWKQKAEIYVANMKRKHRGLDTEALCKLIVTDVNRSLNQVSPHYTILRRQGWVMQPSHQTGIPALKSLEAHDKSSSLATEKDWRQLLQQRRTEVDDPELLDLEPDVRYFNSSELGAATLEQLLNEQPHNVELWLRLAYRHLYGRLSEASEPELRLDHALNVFSQALENNRGSPEVWCHYLGWYAAHPQCSDLDYLCHKALDYCCHNSVWWKCVTLVESLRSKGQLCQQQLYHLTQGLSGGKQPDSHCILEVVLYWAQLCATAGNMPLAFLILKTSVKSVIGFEHFVDSQAVADELMDTTTRDILQCANMLLSPNDLCFLWLCYIHFVEFRTLPATLFCVERGSVGRLCCSDFFEIPWSQRETLTQSLDALLCAHHEGVDELGGPDKCVPLFASHLSLLASRSMAADAVTLCNTALEENPAWSDGWLQLVELHMKSGDTEEAANALQQGLSQLPTDARLVFKAASGKLSMSDIVLRQLLENFVDHHFRVEDNAVAEVQRNIADCAISFPKLVNEADSHAVYTKLNFIELTKLSGSSVSDVSELYETLLTVSRSTSDVQITWWWYLNYRLEAVIRRESGAADAVSALVQRCLERTPVKRPLPAEPRKTWTDHRFKNHMLGLLATHMTSPRDAADLLQSYLGDREKRNLALVQWTVELYLQANDRERAESILQETLVSGLQSLRLWQLGIQLAVTDGNCYEAHRLFEAAVLSMPYHCDLWCHFLIYELTQGHMEHAHKVVESASRYQVPGAQEILNSFLAEGGWTSFELPLFRWWCVIVLPISELTEEDALKRLGLFLLPP